MGWVIRDNLGRVCLADMRYISSCREIKTLAHALCDGLVEALAPKLQPIQVEFDCLKVVILLNGNEFSITEVSFFLLKKVKIWHSSLGMFLFPTFGDLTML